MTSVADICNQVCNQLRSGATVQSINPSDGSLAANVFALEYQPRVDSVSRAAQWNCLRFEQPLTLLRAAAGTYANPTGSASSNPPAAWRYEYEWPSQPFCLRMRYVFPFQPQAAGNGTLISLPSTPLTTGNTALLPNSALRRPAPAPFAVSMDTDASGNLVKVILSNAPYAVGVYTCRVDDPALWDPQFRDCVIMTLAAWTAPPITGSDVLVKQCSALASGIITQARISDGDEGTLTADHIPDWISIRNGGSTFGVMDALPLWDSLSLPLGAV